jgi:apolipoprotein D and lipocalin family protein
MTGLKRQLMEARRGSKSNALLKLFTISLISIMLSSCASNTRLLQPVANFDSNRYLGVWYEIARLPHRFEKNLVAVSTTYALRKDGAINVLNQGYDTVAKKWKSAKGRAYFKRDSNTALLKVTFFWPFYGDYKVISLDTAGYAYSVVTSGTFDYLWILSRNPELDDETLKRLIHYAETSGFDVSRLEYVSQKRPD